jgi:hypothetical protein
MQGLPRRRAADGAEQARRRRSDHAHTRRRLLCYWMGATEAPGGALD